MRSRSIVILTIALAALLGASTALVAAEAEADWKLGLEVKLELLTKLGADGLGVDVDAAEGVVTLSGEVEKRETRELAGTVAGSVDGVRRVDNRLTLEAAENEAGKGKIESELAEAGREVEDGLLETKLRLALIDRLGRDGFRIGTEAASGVVTLEIPKDLDRDRGREAVKIAHGLAGVKKVVTIDKR